MRAADALPVPVVYTPMNDDLYREIIRHIARTEGPDDLTDSLMVCLAVNGCDNRQALLDMQEEYFKLRPQEVN
jgi:hypothetical protein